MFIAGFILMPWQSALLAIATERRGCKSSLAQMGTSTTQYGTNRMYSDIDYEIARPSRLYPILPLAIPQPTSGEGMGIRRPETSRGELCPWAGGWLF